MCMWVHVYWRNGLTLRRITAAGTRPYGRSSRQFRDILSNHRTKHNSSSSCKWHQVPRGLVGVDAQLAAAGLRAVASRQRVPTDAVLGAPEVQLLQRQLFSSHPARSSVARPMESLEMTPQQQQQLLEAVKDRRPVVFYHYPCVDGVFAALAATLYYKSLGVTPRYVPHAVFENLDPKALRLQPDQVVFLLDYSGPTGFPQELAQFVAQVVVLDHHKTAAHQLMDRSSHPANLAVHLDMNRSGATIARDFFLPQGMPDSLKQIFSWVEDADLWRWQLPNSKDFHAGMAALKLEFHADRHPQIWQKLLDLDVQQVLEHGKQILLYQEELISAAVKTSKTYQLGGAQGVSRGWGSCLGCEVSGDLVLYRSRLGNALALQSQAQGLSPVGIVAYNETRQPDADKNIKVSLRGVGDYDTTAVSQAFGGGGHAAASSCIISRQEFSSWQQPSEATTATSDLGSG